MKKKCMKLLIVVLIMIVLFSLPVLAGEIIDVNEWKPEIDFNANTKMKSMAEKILGYMQLVGSIISVIVLMIIGIKYIFASIEERAEYKKTMLPYIIGCIMLFATTNVAVIIYEIAKNI